MASAACISACSQSEAPRRRGRRIAFRSVLQSVYCLWTSGKRYDVLFEESCKIYTAFSPTRRGHLCLLTEQSPAASRLTVRRGWQVQPQVAAALLPHLQPERDDAGAGHGERSRSQVKGMMCSTRPLISRKKGAGTVPNFVCSSRQEEVLFSS